MLIARVSLELLKAVKRFTICHRPQERLKLRICLHSGKLADRPHVSGVPQRCQNVLLFTTDLRNGSNCALAFIQVSLLIVCMSLELRKAVKRFTIRHRPQERLKLRLGLHSGKLADCLHVSGVDQSCQTFYYSPPTSGTAQTANLFAFR